MYAGKIVEYGDVGEVLDLPLHPYTHGLIGSVPSRNKRGEPLRQIPGMTPSLLGLQPGCAFRTRCPRAGTDCAEMPELREWRPARMARCHRPHLESEYVA
jgi:peptide/nickel transport system ATP-binding protein